MRFSAMLLDGESEDGAQVKEGGVWLGKGKGGGRDKGMSVQAEMKVKRGKKRSSPF